jgi:CTP-dependent riboflavin kinase
MIIRGIVRPGLGVGRHLVECVWVGHQVLTKLGLSPYPGTLNLDVGPDYQETLARCLQRGVYLVPSSSDYSAGICIAVRVNDRVRGCIVRPLFSDYPSHKAEVLAPCHLRAFFSLEDGQSVTLNV